MDMTLSAQVQRRLRAAGIQPTLQRLAVGVVLLPRPAHMTADQVLVGARALVPDISRATVYSVLKLFVRSQLLKELPIDGAAAVYDSNLAPHHHLYNIDTGEVTDLPVGRLQVQGLSELGPELGSGLALAEVDVIVRVRQRAPA
jgi:Fur family transcriptional regulator, iron response regulator